MLNLNELFSKIKDEPTYNEFYCAIKGIECNNPKTKVWRGYVFQNTYDRFRNSDTASTLGIKTNKSHTESYPTKNDNYEIEDSTDNSHESKKIHKKNKNKNKYDNDNI